MPSQTPKITEDFRKIPDFEITPQGEIEVSLLDQKVFIERMKGYLLMKMGAALTRDGVNHLVEIFFELSEEYDTGIFTHDELEQLASDFAYRN